MNMAGLLANLSQWWTRRQETASTRQYGYADQMRARDQDREERLHKRIEELEQVQEARDAARDEEIRILRLEIAECQRAHAESRITSAGLQAENVVMKRQLDQLARELERRRHDGSPPPGQPERRDQ